MPFLSISDLHVAYGKVEVSDAVIRQPGSFIPLVPALTGSGSTSSTKTGWTAGVGVETKIWTNWSAKLEYLYVDLGKQDNTFTVLTSPAFGSLAASTFSSSTHFQDHVIRLGLNYKIW